MHLSTAWTVVKSRGEFLTRLVKTNSKRVWLNLDVMQRACVLPLNRDLAFRMEIFSTVPKPIPVSRGVTVVSGGKLYIPYFLEIAAILESKR